MNEDDNDAASNHMQHLHEIFDAIEAKDFKKIEQLVREDPSCLNTQHPDTGSTPLILAIRRRNSHLVEYFCRQENIDPSIKDFGAPHIGRGAYDAISWAVDISSTGIIPEEERAINQAVTRLVNPQLANELWGKQKPEKSNRPKRERPELKQ